MRRTLHLLLLAVLLACGSDEANRSLDPAAGHALLTDYATAFRQLARGAGAEALDPVLAEQAKNGESLKSAGKVTAAFAERHRRLVEVTRAIIAPNAAEAAKQTTRDFLDAVEGKKERALTGGLAEIGPALAEELLRLHMLLDGTSDREATRAKYMPELEP